MPAFLVPLAISGISALAGALGNRKKKVETQSSTTPTFAPEVQGILSQVAPHLQSVISDPSKGLEGLRVAGRDQINEAYANVPQMLAQKYGRNAASGESGKFYGAGQAAEFQRLSQMGGLEQQLLQAAIQRQDSGVQAALQLIGMGRGQNQTGTQTQPGNMLGGAVSNGLDAASFLYTLSQLSKGGGIK